MSNEYRIYKNYYLTDRKYADISKVKALENISGLKYTDEIACWPKKTYDGGKALELKIDDTDVKSRRTVSFEFFQTIDFSGRDTLSVAVNGCTLCDLLTVTLFSSDGRRAEYTVNFFADRWSRLLIDVTGCEFLSSVVGLTVGFFGSKEGALEDERIYIGEIYFGNIVDFSFERGNFAAHFRPQSNVAEGDGFLSFVFDEGEELLFPTFENARYSVLNALLYIKDSVKLSAENKGECKDFYLYIATDKRREFTEDRKVLLNFSEKGLVSRLAKIDGFALSEDERVYAMKLKPATKRGAIDLYDVSFVQEKDFLLDDNAKKFLSEKPVRRRNPYKFSIRNIVYDVKNYGAKGNFYNDDTAAIQAAIDDAAAQGGGVILLENGRFVATHIRMRSNTELRIAKDAILIQSERAEDYSYPVAYEHDNFYYAVNWAHNFLVHNKPFIYSDKIENVRICGGGRIRMADTGSEALMGGWPYYDIHCNALIHILAIAFNHCKNIEISDITVNRANSYHTFFCKCRNVFIDGIRYFDPRCLSGDGIGIFGTANVLMVNSMIVTNDDGVTLNPGYDDPRSHGSWWECTPGQNNTVEHIEIGNCYINSGYGGWGKAIAFIPWGKSAPNQEYALIRDVYVHDCVLDGGHSIGTWCDDPYHGKQPYDGSELDDYSPVCDIVFKNNVYLSKVDLMEIAVTNMVSDSCLRSAVRIVNGNFADGLSNWKASDGVRLDRERGCVFLGENKSLYQIISSAAGSNEFVFEVRGRGFVFVNNKKEAFDKKERGTVKIRSAFSKVHNIRVGITAEEEVTVYSVRKEK